MASIAISELMDVSGVKFGTSGARGLADGITDLVAYSYTAAFLQHLEASGQIDGAGEVAIAGDLRPSTRRIMAAAGRAAADRGCQLTNCGTVPSPTVALYGLTNGIPTIMVTGSHIPDDRNGIKYTSPDGEIMKDDEAGIKAQTVEVDDAAFNADGFFSEPFFLPEEDSTASKAYQTRYLEVFGPEALKGCRLGHYQHSAVGRDILSNLYTSLGAEVINLGRSDTFIPVDTEAIRPEDTELAAQWAAENNFTAILSTDGDSDRPLIADENGKWLRGDVAGILTAMYLGADAVITPISCNSAVEKCGVFKQVSRSRIGSPYVIAGMKQATESGRERVVGYEANGGFLIGSDISVAGKCLRALPTRDAVIIHIAILKLAQTKGMSVAQLNAALPQRFTASDRLQEFPTGQSRARLAGFDTGTPESDGQAFAAVFGRISGEVLGIDRTDGLRVTFENQEVIHLRPSGNAPELRCYTEADSEARAIEMNQETIKIMQGWR